jgi:hypothetical protein
MVIEFKYSVAGLEIIDQSSQSQCRIAPKSPTAQTSATEVIATEDNPL